MTARPSHRLAAALAATALAVGLAAPAPAGAALPDPSGAALDWVKGELADDGGYLKTAYEYEGMTYSYDDWGLTIDVILGLAADGQGGGAAAQTADGFVEDNAAAYFTGTGSGYPAERYAGPLAKAMLMALVQGEPIADFGGFDLETELRALMQTTGGDTGRFSDKSDPANTFGGDFSNGFGQALAIMALDRTSGGAPAEAVQFLLDQQCPGGGFRGSYSTPGGCTDDASATIDYTAFAVMALFTVTPDCATRQAVTEAVAWMLDEQQPDGGFAGDGGAASSNTSGLAGTVLAALGYDDEAAAAAGFITTLQLESGDDTGAIAGNAAIYATAADGVQELERDGFRRATGQAVLGLGLPSYAEIGPGGTAVAPAAFAPCAAPTPPPAAGPSAESPRTPPAAQPVVTSPTYTG